MNAKDAIFYSLFHAISAFLLFIGMLFTLIFEYNNADTIGGGIKTTTLDYGIFEINAPEKIHNKSLKELDLRRKYDINIIGIKNSSSEPNVNPDPETIISEDSVLLIMTGLNNVDIFNNF